MTVDSLRGSVGQEVACTDWFTVTQEQIDSFAAATGDRQWIHVDRERARRESPYGATVAHGFLTLAQLSRFFSQAIQVQDAAMAVNYGLNRVRFPAPVRSGCQIRARFRLDSLRDIDGVAEGVFSVTIEAERLEKPVCVAEWVIRFYRRSEFNTKERTAS